MDVLLNPNVAYLLLAGGLTFAMLALLNPGTGLLEIIALFMLLLAGFGIYNLPINLWSLGILVIGAVMFVIAVFRTKGTWIFLVISIAAIMLGSVFLFSGEIWWKPSGLRGGPWFFSLFTWSMARLPRDGIRTKFQTSEALETMCGVTYSDGGHY